MKNVPELRFKGLESNYEIKKISSLLERVSNSVDVNPIEFYRQIGIRSHGKGIFYKDAVSGESLGNKRVFWVEPNVFILNIVFAWERAVAKTTDAEIGMIASHRFPMYKPKSGVLDLDYITLFFKTTRGKYLLELASPGGAGRNKTLGQKEFENLELAIPTIFEQKKIASFFSLIDKKIELQTEKVEELKNYKKGLMQKIFSQELRFKGFSGEWESKKIGSICEIIMGQSPSSACYNEDKIGLPLIQGNADIKNRKTFPRVYTSDITKTCDVGDIIMSVRAPVGAISKSLHHACIGRGVCSIKPKQNSEFIYQFLLNYENKWSRISQGSTFESINSFDITSTNIVLPLKEEQEKIASFFSLIDKKLELEMEKLEQLQEYKKGLLQQMFI